MVQRHVDRMARQRRRYKRSPGWTGQCENEFQAGNTVVSSVLGRKERADLMEFTVPALIIFHTHVMHR